MTSSLSFVYKLSQPTDGKKNQLVLTISRDEEHVELVTPFVIPKSYWDVRKRRFKNYQDEPEIIVMVKDIFTYFHKMSVVTMKRITLKQIKRLVVGALKTNQIGTAHLWIAQIPGEEPDYRTSFEELEVCTKKDRFPFTYKFVVARKKKVSKFRLNVNDHSWSYNSTCLELRLTSKRRTTYMIIDNYLSSMIWDKNLQRFSSGQDIYNSNVKLNRISEFLEWLQLNFHHVYSDREIDFNEIKKIIDKKIIDQFCARKSWMEYRNLFS